MDTIERLYWYLLGASDRHGYVSVEQHRMEKLLCLYKNEFEYWMQRLEQSGRVERVVGYVGGRGGCLYRVNEDLLSMSAGKATGEFLQEAQVPAMQGVREKRQSFWAEHSD